MLRTLLAVSVFTALGSAAAFGQVLIGVKGSAQLAGEKFSGAGVTVSTDNIVGFQAGLMVNVPISDQLSIRPQLLYSTKGFKLSSGALGGVGEAKAGINYLELPIQLAYSFKAGDGNLVIGAGPYAAYALNGKFTATVNGQTTTQSLDLSTADAQKRLE